MADQLGMFMVGGRRRTAGQHLRLMLDAQGQVCAPYPNHIYWDMQALLPMYGDLSDDRAYKMLVKHVVGASTVALENWRMAPPDAEHLFERLRDRPVRNVHAVSCDLLRLEAEGHGARVAFDKSPDNIADWPNIMQAYPNMKWLHMVRHPLDQVASMAEAIIYPHDPLLTAQILKESLEAAEAMSRAHPDRVLLLSYERFMEDPWTTLQRVCEFADIKASPDMLQVHKSEKAKAFAVRSDLWKANDQAPDPGNIGRGRKRLTQRQIAETETLLRPYMQQNGYALETSEDVAIPEDRWSEANQVSAAAGVAKWHALKAQKPDEHAARMNRIRYFEGCRKELEGLGPH